jgi:FtsP/CotA-like multicopper oxidase with cupredoxin domain
MLPPGKRYDVLVQGPAAGTYRLRTLRYNTGPAGDTYPERTLATVTSAGQPVQPADLPAGQSLPALLQPGFAKAKVDRERRITFSERGNRFFINGKQFNHDRIDHKVRLGDVEEWTIKNRSGEQHPFHIHVNQFQVMSINGRKIPPSGLQDTVPLPVGGTVVIRMKFIEFTGKFVFHCHILNHEDHGMMSIVQVVEPKKKKAGRPNVPDLPERPRAATAGAAPAARWPLRSAQDLLCPLPAVRADRTATA